MVNPMENSWRKKGVSRLLQLALKKERESFRGPHHRRCDNGIVPRQSLQNHEFTDEYSQDREAQSRQSHPCHQIDNGAFRGGRDHRYPHEQ
jgi:hypothetical protein